MRLKSLNLKRAPSWSRRRQGIALILVMLVIMVLAVMASSFASNMSVEAALARNASNDRRLEWLCRSGVELARYMVGQQFAEQREPYDALNQRWAGGPGTLEDCVLNAVNLNLIAVSSYVDSSVFSGLIIAIFVITVAAASPGGIATFDVMAAIDDSTRLR